MPTLSVKTSAPLIQEDEQAQEARCYRGQERQLVESRHKLPAPPPSEESISDTKNRNGLDRRDADRTSYDLHTSR